MNLGTFLGVFFTLLLCAQGQTKYGLTDIITDQPVLEFLITPVGYAYAFATSPVTVSPVFGATSYTITKLGVILRFPSQADLVGSFSFGIYADSGGKPSGSPIVATTVSTIPYAPGEFDSSLFATRAEFPVNPTKLTAKNVYWVAAACAPDTPLYIYGTSQGGSPVYGNQLRTLPDSARLVEDPGMGSWELSFYLVVDTAGSNGSVTNPPGPSPPPPPSPGGSSGGKKSKAWLIPVIIIVVIVALLAIAAAVYFGRKHIHFGYSNAIKPHQQQLLDDSPSS